MKSHKPVFLCEQLDVLLVRLLGHQTRLVSQLADAVQNDQSLVALVCRHLVLRDRKVGRVRDVVRRSPWQPLRRCGRRRRRYRSGSVGNHRGVGHRPGGQAQAAGGGRFPRGVCHAWGVGGPRGIAGSLRGPGGACGSWGVWRSWCSCHPGGVRLGGGVGLPRGGGGHGLIRGRLD